MSDSLILPNGDALILRVLYTGRESTGIALLVVVSCISLCAVTGLLLAIMISAFNTRSSLDKHLFVRTHVAAYFVSLLLCDMAQAIGSIINARWIHDMAVEESNLCTIQGVFKQLADVGTAFWTLVIAIHTFFLLVLQMRMRRYVLWATLVSGWAAIAAIVIAGPATLDTHKNGPFFAISGYWCWISPEYQTERVTLDYMMMFIAAFSSFILYSLVFLKLRGNILINGWHVRFRWVSSTRLWRGREQVDNQLLAIARQMLLYPVAYTILLLPIAAARFSSWAGHDTPFGVTIFCDTVFLFSGTVNVVLFTTTRRILPPKSISIGKWSISRPRLVHASPVLENAADPYYPKTGSQYPEESYQEKKLQFTPTSALSSGLPDSTSYTASSSESSDVSTLRIDGSIPPLRPGDEEHDVGSREPRAPPPPGIAVPSSRGSMESMYSLYHQRSTPIHSESSTSAHHPYSLAGSTSSASPASHPYSAQLDSADITSTSEYSGQPDSAELYLSDSVHLHSGRQLPLDSAHPYLSYSAGPSAGQQQQHPYEVDEGESHAGGGRF